MKKKLLSVVVVGTCMVMSAFPALASTDSVAGTGDIEIAAMDKNYGVSPIEPTPGVETRSISKPRDIWDISSQGIYNFGGEASNSTLYTNYKFKGKTSYTITINNNHGSKTLSVRCIGAKGSVKVKAGKTGTIKISGIKADKTFYISFSAPSNFDGTVK